MGFDIIRQVLEPRRASSISVTSNSAFPERPRPLNEALCASPSSQSAQMITTASRPYIIQHVNQAWTDLFGWSSDEAVGRTIRSLGLQGVKTSRSLIESLHEALAANGTRSRHSLSTTIVNYTKDGRPFGECASISLMTFHLPSPIRIRS